MSDSSSAWQQALEHYERLMATLLVMPGLGGRSLGAPEWDAALQRLGREWIAASTLEWHTPPASGTGDQCGPSRTTRCDVYLATQLYETGGHTALIGDFVRALDGQQGHQVEGRHSHLVLTGLFGQNQLPLPPAIQGRIGVPAGHVSLLPGPTLGDRASQLFALLHRLRPERLFLFQHPHDVLASVCGQPDVAAQTVLVHHSDGYPTFGLHLPHVQVIDLNPSAAALTRLLGARSCQIALTAPDPGRGPEGFLRRGALVTASCGTAHKFFRDYLPRYPEVVAGVLRATGGWHVHVGALDDSQREQVGRALDVAGCPRDRFEHVPFSPSLAQTLRDHECDVFLASFPISGARTRVEVLAAGIPYVRHSQSPPGAFDHRPGDASVWHREDELLACLGSLGDQARLATAASTARAEYERAHHPAVFAATLTKILDTGCAADPDAQERRLVTLESMARTTIAALLPRPVEPVPPDPRLATIDQRLGELQRHADSTDQIRQQCATMAATIEALARERDHQRRALDEARVDWQREFDRWQVESRREIGRLQTESQLEIARARNDATLELERRLAAIGWRQRLRRWLRLN